MAIYVYHNPDFLEFYRGAGPETPDLRRLYLAAIVDPDELHMVPGHMRLDTFGTSDSAMLVGTAESPF